MCVWRGEQVVRLERMVGIKGHIFSSPLISTMTSVEESVVCLKLKIPIARKRRDMLYYVEVIDVFRDITYSRSKRSRILAKHGVRCHKCLLHTRWGKYNHPSLHK